MSNPGAKKQYQHSPGHGSSSESSQPDSPEAHQIPTKRMRQDEPSTSTMGSTDSQDTTQTHPETSEQIEPHKQGKIFMTLKSWSNMYAEDPGQRRMYIIVVSSKCGITIKNVTC